MSVPGALRIGRIPYTNLFPVFVMLDRIAEPGRYDFIEGPPSAVNQKLRDAEIDASPSSSIEYLRHPGRYALIDDHSISSAGPVRSIFLLSRGPVERLDGKTVLVTTQSETSVALLEVIARKFYGISPVLEPSSEPFEEAMRSRDAYLLIGDDALLREHASGYEILDLGEVWFRFTGLPFVFALWLVRNECLSDSPDRVADFCQDLGRAKALALENLEEIARLSPLRGSLSPEALVSYWKGISYDFRSSHKTGLDLFARYCRELGLLPS